MNYLKLIRLPNLLILALAMYMMRLMVVEPLLILSKEAPVISDLNFFLMVLATVLIAAAGNVINDIQDVETDEINKSSKMIVNKKISSDHAWNFYLILTFTGICIGFYLTFLEQVRYIAYIEMIAAGLLYFYSTTYKCIILVGNVLVAALSAFSLALPYLTEPAAPSVDALKQLATGYIIYAFMLSLVREVIKDMQDLQGDKQVGCKTLPVVAGIMPGKILNSLLIIALLAGIIVVQLASRQWETPISFTYVLLLIQIPLILLLVSVIISTSSRDFARSSTLAKFIMVTGILSMPVFFYTF